MLLSARSVSTVTQNSDLRSDYLKMSDAFSKVELLLSFYESKLSDF